MTKIKTKFHNRKFYGKWLFKITLEIHGAYLLRREANSYNTLFNRYSDDHRQQILDLKNYLDVRQSLGLQTRIESNCVDIYTNDRTVYDDISKDFADIVKHRYEAISTEGIDNDGHQVFVKKLPHDTYQYKVFLKPHTFDNDDQSKKIYLEWLGTQGSKIKISDKVKEWFMITNWNWDRRYIYVEDESTLLMLSMRNPNVLGTVYKHIIIDK